MENKKKKDLAKIALTAFLLSASLPAAGNASGGAEAKGTLLAGGGCGAASSNRPASSSCGASQGRYSPSTHSCGASQGSYYSPTGNAPQRSPSPATGSCGAHQGRYSPASSSCGAASSNRYPSSHACGASQNPYNHAPASHGCAASTGEENLPPPPAPSNNKPANRQKPVAWNESRTNGSNRPAGSMGSIEDSNSSSYQGTTTGPGPNDGYPGSPKGSYDTNPPQRGR